MTDDGGNGAGDSDRADREDSAGDGVDREDGTGDGDRVDRADAAHSHTGRDDETRTVARYEDWPLEDGRDEEATYVGITSPGFPVFHRSGSVLKGEPDEERGVVTPLVGSERELDPAETLADVIEEIGDAVGWNSLSAYGREHEADE